MTPQLSDAEFCEQARKLFEAGLVPWPEWEDNDDILQSYWKKRLILHGNSGQVEWFTDSDADRQHTAYRDPHEAAFIIERALRVWLKERHIYVTRFCGLYLPLREMDGGLIDEPLVKDGCFCECRDVGKFQVFKDYREGLLAACRKVIGEKP